MLQLNHCITECDVAFTAEYGQRISRVELLELQSAPNTNTSDDDDSWFDAEFIPDNLRVISEAEFLNAEIP